MENHFVDIKKMSLFGLGLFPIISAINAFENNSKPNVIFIMADDLGYGDLSCYGAIKIKTPNIDRLAAEGIRFTDAHSPASVSTPSRYGVLTGRYCWRGRLKKEVLWCGYTRSLIEPGRKTVGNMMKEQGYHTAHIGKWHLGWEDEEPVDYSKGYLARGPKNLGFDYSFVTAAAHNIYPIVFVENHKILSKFKEINYHLYQREKTSIPEHMMRWHKTHDLGPMLIAENWQRDLVDSIYTEKAVGFIRKHIKENPNQPFYLHFTPDAPHLPNNVPDFMKGKSTAGCRGDHIQMLDWMVGKIVDTLKETGAYNNTLIIFTSDNGAIRTGTDGRKDGVYGAPFVTDFGHKSCGELKGYKTALFEGGHRIPLIVSWKKIFTGKKINDNLVCTIDLMATLADLTNYKIGRNMGEDSFSILPMLYGDTVSVRKTMIMQHYNGKLGIRKGNWVYFEDNLYNVKDDLKEKNNLYKEYPEKVKELSSLLEKQIKNNRTAPDI